MDKLAKVRIVGQDLLIPVTISSAGKPEIDGNFISKWQKLVNLAARIVNVPSGLIMRLHERDIEVYLASETPGNPYEEKERAKLGLGLYCETVVGKRKPLIVPNALEDRDWENNPDVELNMISYLGVPVTWPDGEVFGTFCVLDSRKKNYTEDQEMLLQKFAELIEHDLELLLRNKEHEHTLAQMELRNREIRHRIKNQLNLLVSYINLQIGRDDKLIETPDLISELKSRITSVAMVHEKLSTGPIGTDLTLLDYCRDLISSSLLTAPGKIDFTVSGDPTPLSERSLVSLGMLLHELVTNSIKYAFQYTDRPHIGVSLTDDGSTVTLEYRDNGTFHSGGTEHTPGLGTIIINSLADQLSATLQKDVRSGYFMKLTFKR